MTPDEKLPWLLFWAAVLGFAMSLTLNSVLERENARLRAARPGAAETTGHAIAAPTDANSVLWQTGDSVGVQVTRIPHGRGVVVEIMPVRKAKQPATAGRGGKHGK